MVSDFQTGSWDENLPPVPASVRVTLVPVGEAGGNLSLAGLEASSRQTLPGEALEVVVRVRNHSAERRAARVAVTAGSSRQVRDLALEPWGEGQLLLETEVPEEEVEFAVQARLEGGQDPLAGDDKRQLVARRGQPLRVFLDLSGDGIGEAERDLWERALRSLEWTETTPDVSRADYWVGSGPADAAAISGILGRGGSVFHRPTEGAVFPEGIGPETGVGPGIAGSGESAADGGEGWRVRPGREDDPWFSLFASGEVGDPAAGLTRKRWRPGGNPVAGGRWEGWEAPLVYEDGVPAVLRRREGQGLVWWWNLPPDPDFSTWPLQAGFLPLLGEALLLSRPRGEIPLHWEVPPGVPARWEPPRFPDGGRVVLLDEAGEVLPVNEDPSTGGLAYRSLDGLAPGLYRWALRDEALERDVVLALTAVNYPPSEMDDRAVDSAILEEWIQGRVSVSSGSAPNWKALREGVSLWPLLLSAALGLFAVEAVSLWTWARRRGAARRLGT